MRTRPARFPAPLLARFPARFLARLPAPFALLTATLLLALTAAGSADALTPERPPSAVDGLPAARAATAEPQYAKAEPPDAVAAARALAAPGVPGANDFGCRTDADHPRPVVLVHGTFENGTQNWPVVSRALKADGWCVFALTYGYHPGLKAFGGVRAVEHSAGQLDVFVRGVLAATGAEQADLVGHSLGGGMVPRYWMKFLGGAPLTHRLVGLSPSNHGTTFFGVKRLQQLLPIARDITDVVCRSCNQQLTGSETLQRINEGGDTLPGVAYTTIVTRHDLIITPYESQFLAGPDVDNVLLQERCPANRATHLTISYDRQAVDEVRHALAPSRVPPATCGSAVSG